METISRRALLLSLVATVAIGLIAFRVTVATTGGFLVWSDGLAYFFHARSLVLDANSDITNEFDEFDRRYPKGQPSSAVMDSIRRNVTRNDQGLIVSPWPIGMGMVAMPFYAAGYLVESLTAGFQNRKPDSYGLIPQYFFALSSLIFGWLGFWSTYLCCRKISDRSRSYLATFAVVFGSPAVFYIFVNPSMAHAVSFGICAVFILNWLSQWLRGPSVRVMAILGFLLGLLIAIRLQNAIFGSLLATLVIRQIPYSGWISASKLALAGIATCALPLSALALHSLAYSASHGSLAIQQNGIAVIGNYPIHLMSPFFWDVLFACRHGAFNWAPVLAIGTLGIICCVPRRLWIVPLLIVLVLNVYLIGGIGIVDPSGKIPTFDTSNWNDHWKGGASFGMRYLTEVTPIFAIGLAGLLNLFFRGMFTKICWHLVLIGMIVWNGLLVLAYGLNTISRTHCVTYGERWTGVIQVLGKFQRDSR